MDCSSYIFKYSQDFVFWTCFLCSKDPILSNVSIFQNSPQRLPKIPQPQFQFLEVGIPFRLRLGGSERSRIISCTSKLERF